GARREALHDKTLADMCLGDDEVVDVEVVIVFGVGDRRLQALAHILGDALARELQVGERRRHRLAADQRGDKGELLGADPDVARHGLGLVVGEAAFALLLAHVGSSPANVSWWGWRRWYAWPCGRPHGRRTCGSARTRRTCGRPSPRSPAPECASARCRRRTSARRTAAGWWSGGSRSLSPPSGPTRSRAPPSFAGSHPRTGPFKPNLPPC